MQAKIIGEESRKEWNDFVVFSDGSILQSYEWGELKARVGWEPIRIALYDGEKIAACVSVLKKSVPIPGKSFFYAPRGPVCPLDNSTLLKEILDAVRIEAKKHKAISLKIDPPVLGGEGVEKVLSSSGFVKKQKQVQPRATFYVDLDQSLDNLIGSFEEKTRYNIRLSERKGVTVRRANDLAGIETYYKIYKETSARDKFLIHPISYYRNIKELLIDKGLASVFLAYYKDEPIAGVFVFSFGNKVWYMYGASSNEARNVMPNHALHWHVVKWAKEAGYKIYDLWGIPSNPKEGHPLWGVYRFKKGFNGKLVKYVGVWDLPFDPISYHVFDKGMIFWKNLRSLLTKGKIEDSLAE
jgi:lipid II:glycine glycyltransferase (peptidoglycan interpeptide bridge formation enzyme)